MAKKPIRVLKKKFADKFLFYKIEWSNGSISYEPLREMNEEMLIMVEKWEIKKYNEE